MAEKCMKESDDVDCMKINDYEIPDITPQRRPVEGEKVERIVVCFTPKSSEAIIKAIREKYGKPFFHENISYQNAFGATMVGFQEAWNWKGGVAMLSLMPDPIYGWPHMFAQYDIRTKAYDDKGQTELKKKPKL